MIGKFVWCVNNRTQNEELINYYTRKSRCATPRTIYRVYAHFVFIRCTDPRVVYIMAVTLHYWFVLCSKHCTTNQQFVWFTNNMTIYMGHKSKGHCKLPNRPGSVLNTI
jgi:hypothetical protein